MHPSQMSGFRKTIIACLTIGFAGALLVFTAQANLDLLRSIYPNPQFYMFGLLALEGGTVYWTGYYLLHASGSHKGLAVIALTVDAALSGTGFFVGWGADEVSPRSDPFSTPFPQTHRAAFTAMGFPASSFT